MSKLWKILVTCTPDMNPDSSFSDEKESRMVLVLKSRKKKKISWGKKITHSKSQLTFAISANQLRLSSFLYEQHLYRNLCVTNKIRINVTVYARKELT